LENKPQELIPGTETSDRLSELEVTSIVTSIYNKHNDGLRKYLTWRLNSKDEVDVVTQEVYLHLLKHPQLDQLQLTLTLLCKIASNIIIDRYRSDQVRERNAHVPLDWVPIPSATSTSEQYVKTKEGIKAFYKKFEGMSKKCQRAYILSRFKGMTYDEIARELGVSKSSVNKYISNVLLELSEIIEIYI